MKQSANGKTIIGDKEQWFDTARVLNDDWVLVKLTTPQGEQVHYRIPQNGFLQEADDLQEAGK